MSVTEVSFILASFCTANVYSPYFDEKTVLIFLMLNCVSCLYILDINPLLVISSANILSHSVGCLFILLMVSFAVQKLLSLIRSHLFIFALISFASGDGSNLIGFCFFLIYIGLYEQCFLEVNILKSLKFWSRLAS